MLPVILCKKFPLCKAGLGGSANGALPAKTSLVIEIVAAPAPCEKAQSAMMLNDVRNLTRGTFTGMPPRAAPNPQFCGS